MTSEKSREDRLRRLARKEDQFFHKARRPFFEWGVSAEYYVSDMSNMMVAVYTDLDAAEEEFSLMRELSSQPLETGQYAPAQSVPTCECSETMSAQQEAEVWDEDKTGFKNQLLLRSDSFCPKPLFDTVPSHTWFSGILSPSRAYLYTNRILPAGQRLKLALSPRQEGTVEFDGDAVIPTLFDLSETDT